MNREGKTTDRETRLAMRLRDNLRRRKQQARGGVAAEGPPAEDAPVDRLLSKIPPPG